MGPRRQGLDKLQRGTVSRRSVLDEAGFKAATDGGSLHHAGGDGLILGGGGEVVAGDAAACSRIFFR